MGLVPISGVDMDPQTKFQFAFGHRTRGKIPSSLDHVRYPPADGSGIGSAYVVFCVHARDTEPKTAAH